MEEPTIRMNFEGNRESKRDKVGDKGRMTQNGWKEARTT